MIKQFLVIAALTASAFCQETNIEASSLNLTIPEKSGPHDFDTPNAPTPSPKFKVRVINGHQARDGQFPWVVRLSIGVEGSGFLCTGSIISSTFILTARHCIAGIKATFIEASVGSVDSQGSSAQRVYVDMAWYLTVNVNGEVLEEQPDIAIFRLSTPLTFSDRVRPVRLPKRSHENETFAGRQAVFSGWGGANNGIPRYLQFGTFTMRSDCGFSDTQLCSKGIKNADARGGDSGGPLVIFEDEPTQIGVLVFGTRDLAGSTRVAKYLQFINDVTGIPIRD